MKSGTHLLGRLRAQLAELGGTVMDVVREASSRRLLDEQVRLVDEEVRVLRRELDTLRAQRFTGQERRDAAVAKIVQREAQALAAIQAGRHDLARDVAEAIVELERERDAEAALLAQNEAQGTALEVQLLHGGNVLRRLRHELDLLRATEAVASAEEAFSQRAPGDGLGIPTAIDSAERLKSRGARADSVADSPADPLEDADLDEKLRAAGVVPTLSPVDVVLERLVARAAEQSRPPVRTRRTAKRKETP